MKACKKQTYSLLAVALLVLSSSWACRLPGTACEADTDCPEDGLCLSTVCVQRCTTTPDCDGRGVCDADGRCVADEDGHDAGQPDDAGPSDAGQDAGPDDPDAGTDAGPDDITVSLVSDAAAVNAGTSVALTWSSAPVADDCQLEERVGTGAYSPVSGAPTTASGMFTVAPLITTQYRVTCSSALGTGDAAVTVDVASLGNVTVTPEALGPAAEQVTLDFEYTGPGDCLVSGPTDEETAVAGHQATLSATTMLTITCAGYGADLVESVEVTQLITSFTAPAAIVDYGAVFDLEWVLEDDATTTCTLEGAAATSPHSVTFTESRDHELECTQDGKVATATVYVSVRPGFLGAELTGTLSKEAPADPEASVLLLATPTLNATACSASASHFSTPQPMVLSSVETDHQVFELDVTRSVGEGPTADGVVTYMVECESDVGVSAPSFAEVIVWWGGLTLADLGEFESSGAKMVTGALNLFGANNPDFDGASGTGGLTKLEEVGGSASLSSMIGITSLKGFESLRRVLGNLSIEDNPSLRDLSVGAAEGLVALDFVFGDLTISGNDSAGAGSAILPALERIEGGLTVSSNTKLATISMSALSSVGGGLIIEENWEMTNPPPLGMVDLRSLTSVGASGGGFVLRHTKLQNFTSIGIDGYAPFGSLTAVGTGIGDELEVRNNLGLPCGEVLDAYCSWNPRPASLNESSNLGTCDDTCL